MNHRILLTFLLIGCLFRYGQAQRDTLPQLTLSLGPAHLTRQDMIFSSFRHTDFAPVTFGLLYEKNKRVHQFVNLDYAGFSAGLETPYDILLDDSIATADNHSFTFVELDYGWGKWLGKNQVIQSLVGGSFTIDIQASNYNYGIFGFFGYYATFGAGLWYKGIYQVSDRHRITGQADIPLVSWYARSPYLVNDDEFIENIYSHNGFTTFFDYLGDGELVTWNKLQAFNLSLDYLYTLSGKWSIGAGWRFSFIHATDPLPLTSVQNNFSILVGLKL